jgi:mandelate racemase
MAIMVDYNQSLTPPEACMRIRVLDDEGVMWVEEPTLAHDFDGHAQVARDVRTPIQSGENWWGTLDLRHAIDACASDFVMLDVMKVGGVTGWMRGAAMAHVHGLPVSSHLWPEISAQLLCATPTAHWLEYADWWNPIIAEPLRLDDGYARVDGVLGTGVAWNEAAVAKFSLPF